MLVAESLSCHCQAWVDDETSEVQYRAMTQQLKGVMRLSVSEATHGPRPGPLPATHFTRANGALSRRDLLVVVFIVSTR